MICPDFTLFVAECQLEKFSNFSWTYAVERRINNFRGVAVLISPLFLRLKKENDYEKREIILIDNRWFIAVDFSHFICTNHYSPSANKFRQRTCRTVVSQTPFRSRHSRDAAYQAKQRRMVCGNRRAHCHRELSGRCNILRATGRKGQVSGKIRDAAHKDCRALDSTHNRGWRFALGFARLARERQTRRMARRGFAA